ncbi:MAG TPA: PEGA domain-containing protein [Polyangiaceae bacterium]|nr:PEGA domain-containing protein [Polyangiaceae bacterium]
MSSKDSPRLFSSGRRASPGRAARPGHRASTGRTVWLRRLLPLLLTLLWALQAQAAGPNPAMDAIRQRMDEGQALFVAGKYKEAADVFEQGYAQHPYSAFLFNAGVCHQKLGQTDQALTAFRTYLQKDAKAPDAPQVRERIAKLEALQAAPPATPGTQPTPPTETPEEQKATMKSLVVVETEPGGAPVKVYRRTDPTAAPFGPTGTTPGWEMVAERRSPTDFTLDVGHYHIVVEKYGDYNKSETDLDVSPGHVHQFKANLSQGAFMSFLRVRANVPGAYLFVDDPARKIAWGRAPYGELIAPGKHEIAVEAPGFEPLVTQVEMEAGEQKELELELVRLGFGVVRVDSNVPQISVWEAGKPLGTWKKGDVALELKLSSGAHELSIVSDGYKDLRTTVEVPRGQVLPLRAEMIPSYPRGTAWAQAIIAAGLIGASTYFAVESNRLNDELVAERAAGNLSPTDPRLDQGFWYSVGADGGFALGALFGGLSIYNFVRDPYPESTLRKGKRKEFEDQRGTPGEAPSTPHTSQGAAR